MQDLEYDRPPRSSLASGEGSATRSSTKFGDAGEEAERIDLALIPSLSSAALGALLGRGSRRRPPPPPGPLRRRRPRALLDAVTPDRLPRPDPDGRAVGHTRGQILGFDLRGDRSARADFDAAPAARPCPSAPYSSASLGGRGRPFSATRRADAIARDLKPSLPRLISDREIRSRSRGHDRRRRSPARPTGRRARAARPRSMGAARDMAAGGERLLAVTLDRWSGILEREAKALANHARRCGGTGGRAVRPREARVPRPAERMGPTTPPPRPAPAPRRPPRAARLSRTAAGGPLRIDPSPYLGPAGHRPRRASISSARPTSPPPRVSTPASTPPRSGSSGPRRATSPEAVRCPIWGPIRSRECANRRDVPRVDGVFDRGRSHLLLTGPGATGFWVRPRRWAGSEYHERSTAIRETLC